jgi:hypothetical protein
LKSDIVNWSEEATGGQFYLASAGALEPKGALRGSGFVSVCERGDPERGILTDGDMVMLCLCKSKTAT